MNNLLTLKDGLLVYPELDELQLANKHTIRAPDGTPILEVESLCPGPFPTPNVSFHVDSEGNVEVMSGNILIKEYTATELTEDSMVRTWKEMADTEPRRKQRSKYQRRRGKRR